MDRRTLSDDAGYIVGIALLLVIFVNAGAGAAVAKGSIKADHADYVVFAALYLHTFLLSLTMTVAVGSYAITRMYGYDTPVAVPLGVIILGGYVTGRPVQMPSAAQAHHPRVWLAAWALGALTAFATYYGSAFFGGTVVGAASGLLLAAAAHHRRGEPLPQRPAQPWGAEVGILIAVIVVASYVVSRQ